jgi:GTP-binding protein EngB required for normal cell division
VKVITAEFVTSAAAGGRAGDIPADGLAQIAFAGRSNVGKSTLLNALTRTKLARTSAAPGKTRLANIFRVTLDGGPGGPGRWSVYFVDLPGYGYARGGTAAAAELSAVAAAYFGSGSVVRGARSDRRDSTDSDRGSRITHPGREQTDDRGSRFVVRGSSGPEANSEQRDANRDRERTNRATLHLIDARHPALPADLDAARWFDAIGVDRHVVAPKIDKLSRAERDRNL